eukprot:TRINITY_DN645_c1_g1_i6.p1 TRINITY_DN645_c1_g1~~TRINITY_DN645_c1_g1_i6.p1  ORF type:complete len:825 (+),score=111.16 TRINITY_DN645_c1_g1_i6:267-2741(+)
MGSRQVVEIAGNLGQLQVTVSQPQTFISHELISIIRNSTCIEDLQQILKQQNEDSIQQQHVLAIVEKVSSMERAAVLAKGSLLKKLFVSYNQIVEDLRDDHLASFLHSLGKCRYDLHTEAKQVIQQTLSSTPSTLCSLQYCSYMIQGLADLNLHNQPILNNLSQQIITILDEKTAQINSQDKTQLQHILYMSDLTLVKEIMHAYNKVGYSSCEAAESIAKWFITNIEQIEAEDLADFLQVFAKIGLENHQVNKIFVQRAIQLANQFNGKQISSSVWAIATLNSKNKLIQSDKQIYNEFYAASVKLVMSHVLDPCIARNYSNKDFSTLLMGYAKANFYDRGLLNDISHQIQNKLIQSFDGKDLSCIMWAYSKLNYKDYKLFQILGKQAVQKIDEMDSKSLISILWSFANIQFRDKHLQGFFINKLNEKKFINLEVKDLTDFAWSISVLRHNSKVLFQKISNASIQKLNLMSSHEKGKLAWAFSNINYFNQDFLENLANSIFSDENLQNAENISNSVQTLATIQYYNKDSFEQIIQNAIPVIQQFNTQQIAQIIYACAIFNHMNDEFFEQIQQQILFKFDQFKYSQLIFVLWSMAIVRRWDENFWKNLGQKISQNQQINQTNKNLKFYDNTDDSQQQIQDDEQQQLMNNNDINNQYDLNQYKNNKYDLQDVDLQRLTHIYNIAHANNKMDQINALNFQDTVWIKAKEVWNKQLSKKSNASDAQLSVFRALKYMDLEPLLEQKIEHGQIQIIVDVMIKRDDRQIAVEFDGPQHFTRNFPCRKTGKTLARDRILRACGLEVVSIPFYDWEKQPDKTHRKNYLKKLLKL